VPTPPPTRRRWFQFSLRTFLIAITALAAAIGYPLYRIRLEDRSRLELIALGCVANQELSPTVLQFQNPFAESAEPRGPKWLRQVAGDCVLDHVLFVDCAQRLDDRKDVEAALQLLEPMSRLKTLSLADCPITDEDLRALGHLRSLRTLSLDRTSITDASAPRIAKFEELEELSLSGTAVTGDALRHLAGLSRLHTLRLSRLAVRSEDLAWLAGLPLKVLYLDRTQIDDSAASRLIDHLELVVLILSHTNTSDDLIRSLTQLPNLQVLSVRHTNVTDECGEYLTRIKSLNEVRITGTHVSEAVRDDLKRKIYQFRESR
jgi:Leucine-rich repeat (LRR) protein